MTRPRQIGLTLVRAGLLALSVLVPALAALGTLISPVRADVERHANDAANKAS